MTGQPRDSHSGDSITVKEVLDQGQGRGIVFTEDQAVKIAIATTSLLESARRLRAQIDRNDEPASAFRPRRTNP
jgi:hypothetical protein